MTSKNDNNSSFSGSSGNNINVGWKEKINTRHNDKTRRQSLLSNRARARTEIG